MLTDFTFTDTGKSVKIRKVSPMLAADVAAAIPEPLPPEQEVDYGEPKGKVKERNYADPNYAQALRQHSRAIFVAYRRVLVMRSVVIEGEEWKDEVKEYRDFIEKQTGKPLDEPDDLVVYVLRICIGSEEDLTEFLNAVTKRSQPTQEVIDQAKATFRS